MCSQMSTFLPSVVQCWFTLWKWTLRLIHTYMFLVCFPDESQREVYTPDIFTVLVLCNSLSLIWLCKLNQLDLPSKQASSLRDVSIYCTYRQTTQRQINPHFLAGFHHHMKAASCHTFVLLAQSGIVVVEYLDLLNLYLKRENKIAKGKERKEKTFCVFSSVCHWTQWLRHIQYIHRDFRVAGLLDTMAFMQPFWVTGVSDEKTLNPLQS